MRQTDDAARTGEAPGAAPEPLALPAGGAAGSAAAGRPWWLFALLGLVAVLAGAVAASQAAYADRAYPGVTLLGVPLGGSTREQATAALAPRIQALEGRTIVLRDGGRRWALEARDLGLRVEPERLADLAVRFEHDDPPLARIVAPTRGLTGETVELAPRITLDQATINIQLERLAGQIDQPPIDATLAIHPDGSVAATSAQIGRRLDRAASAQRVRDMLLDAQRDEVELVVQETPPQTSDEELAGARAQAERILAQPFVLRGGDKRWSLSRAELAPMLTLDHTPGQPARLLVNESPLRALVRQAAGELDQEVQNARLELKPDLTLELTPARIGRSVDVDASVRAAWSALVAGQGSADLVIHETPPTTTDAQRREAYETAKRMLSGPLAVEAGQQRWALGRDEIAALLRFNGGPGETMAVTVDSDGLSAWLKGIAEQVHRDPVNARFKWDDGRLTPIRESAPGQELDLDAALAQVQQHLISTERTVQLPLKSVPPAVATDDGPKLGISEQIDSGETSFAGAIPEKRHNIALAAERLNGVVVPPGGLFSFNREVGPTTLDAGFQWGFGLEAGNGGVKTIPSVAGGICQVATTLFQPVFWSGYQIEERHWHLYWIPAYTSRGVVGLDATVDADSNLDFQFRNTTPDALLIQSWTEGDTLHFALYGHKPRWQVKVEGPVITNVVKPDETPITEEDPTMPWGKSLVVQTAREGFDSLLVRTVTGDGDQPRVLNLKSSYQPGRNITLVGTRGKPAQAAPSGAQPQGQPGQAPPIDPNRPVGTGQSEQPRQ